MEAGLDAGIDDSRRRESELRFTGFVTAESTYSESARYQTISKYKSVRLRGSIYNYRHLSDLFLNYPFVEYARCRPSVNLSSMIINLRLHHRILVTLKMSRLLLQKKSEL